MKNKYFDLTVGCHFEVYRDIAPLSSFALLFHKRNTDKNLFNMSEDLLEEKKILKIFKLQQINC
jgi:hypothetical protein